MKRTILALVVALLGFGSAMSDARAHANEEELFFLGGVAAGPFEEAMKLLSAELVFEARPHVEELERREPGSAKALLTRARLLFMKGNFPDSLAKIDEAKKADGYDDKLWSSFEDLVRNTQGVVRNHKPHPTSGGHFVLWVEPGVDEVLIPYADRALEKAYEAFGDIFGYRPPEPVPVHVYPRVEDLAAASGVLKVSDIKNSGTIALCKHNRLMITSPRDLLFGYEWLDTLAHEYIHYVIIKASHNTVPIWIHEGLAKFYENRWRESTDNSLTITSQGLLAQGLADDVLITFEQMSPSMAKLPTQEATALAFAEVFTVADYLKRKTGEEGVRALIGHMKQGMSDKQAVAALLGTSFEAFEADWRSFLKTLPLAQLTDGYQPKLYFKSSDKKEDELKDIGQERAESLVYLGDRLRAKERPLAAMKEYRRAVALVGPTSPIIQSKLASALIALEQHQEALEALAPALKLHPEYVLLSIHSGRAHAQLGQFEQAALHYERALEINPFDPDIHKGLKRAYDALGRADQRALAERSLAILEAQRR